MKNIAFKLITIEIAFILLIALTILYKTYLLIIPFAVLANLFEAVYAKSISKNSKFMYYSCCVIAFTNYMVSCIIFLFFISVPKWYYNLIWLIIIVIFIKSNRHKIWKRQSRNAEKHVNTGDGSVP